MSVFKRNNKENLHFINTINNVLNIDMLTHK